MKRNFILALLLCVSLFPAKAADDFKVSFKWCSGSPEIALSSIPKGTEKLEFSMYDLNFPKRHDYFTFNYKGQKTIPCGNSNNFEGPAPPLNSVHTYEYTIKAFDKDGKKIAETKASRKFPE